MTKHCLVDTNLIVRYLTGDNREQARAAAGLFENSDRGELTLVLLPSVLSESVFVLESFYKHPREKIAAVLGALIESPGIQMTDKTIHVDALKRYSVEKMHFVDCTLAAYAATQKYPIASFDQDFKKFEDIRMLDWRRNR
ncbi:MAG TPA: PIN domain-containing protein [Phycisphaerae bacterium]|nr:PIN domain-containing protein [Phycisphaerae bacterium]